MTNLDIAATAAHIRTTATVDGRKVEVVTLRGFATGKPETEVYVEYRDVPGLMEFRGYYEDLAHTAPRVTERVHPVVCAHMRAVRDVRAGLPVWQRVR